MTEKRFNLMIDSEWWFVEDNSIKSNKYRDDLDGDDVYRGLKEGDLTEKEVVDLLNNLHEENQKLKTLNHFLSEKNLSLFDEVKTRTAKQYKLEQEIEDLKSN